MVGLGRVLRQIRALERQGLDYGSLGVLFALAHRTEGARASEIADVLRLDLSTVSRHVRALEEAGHLTRAADPVDGRAWVLRISPEGSDVLQRVMAGRGEVFAAAMHQWPRQEQAQLADLLERLAGNLSDVLQAAPGAPGPAASPSPPTGATV